MTALSLRVALLSFTQPSYTDSKLTGSLTLSLEGDSGYPDQVIYSNNKYKGGGAFFSLTHNSKLPSALPGQNATEIATEQFSVQFFPEIQDSQRSYVKSPKYSATFPCDFKYSNGGGPLLVLDPGFDSNETFRCNYSYPDLPYPIANFEQNIATNPKYQTLAEQLLFDRPNPLLLRLMLAVRGRHSFNLYKGKVPVANILAGTGTESRVALEFLLRACPEQIRAMRNATTEYSLMRQRIESGTAEKSDLEFHSVEQLINPEKIESGEVVLPESLSGDQLFPHNTILDTLDESRKTLYLKKLAEMAIELNRTLDEINNFILNLNVSYRCEFFEAVKKELSDKESEPNAIIKLLNSIYSIYETNLNGYFGVFLDCFKPDQLLDFCRSFANQSITDLENEKRVFENSQSYLKCIADRCPEIFLEKAEGNNKPFLERLLDHAAKEKYFQFFIKNSHLLELLHPDTQKPFNETFERFKNEFPEDLFRDKDIFNSLSNDRED